LVIGQAALQTGIVSPLMVIIVALTGIASFVNPSFGLAISVRLCRFILMLLAGFLGLFGIAVGVLIILIHLASLRRFGVPYLSPLSPFHKSGMKDMFVRLPLWMLQERPSEISKDNPYRMAPDMKSDKEQNRYERKQIRNDKNISMKSSTWKEEEKRVMEYAEADMLSDENFENNTAHRKRRNSIVPGQTKNHY